MCFALCSLEYLQNYFPCSVSGLGLPAGGEAHQYIWVYSHASPSLSQLWKQPWSTFGSFSVKLLLLLEQYFSLSIKLRLHFATCSAAFDGKSCFKTKFKTWIKTNYFFQWTLKQKCMGIYKEHLAHVFKNSWILLWLWERERCLIFNSIFLLSFSQPVIACRPRVGEDFKNK